MYNPGEGAAYSGDDYVLLGMVLAAVTGAERWSDFDQMAAIGGSTIFNETVFMKVRIRMW